MPAQPHEIVAAEREGIEIVELVAPTRVLGNGKGVTGLELQRMELRGFDRSGRKKPIAIEGSQFTVDVDTVLSAVSQESELDFLGDEVATEWGRVTVNGRLATSHSKVWAGGDAVSGPAMVIDAIKAGQDAAASIDRALRAAAGDPAYVAPEPEKIEIPFDVDEDASERPQASMPESDPAARGRDFREVELGFTRAQAVAEAARCMRCDLSAEEGGSVLGVEREQTDAAG